MYFACVSKRVENVCRVARLHFSKLIEHLMIVDVYGLMIFIRTYSLLLKAKRIFFLWLLISSELIEFNENEK